MCKIQFYTKNIKIIYQSIIQLLTKKGSSNVTVIDTSDSFCLNAVVEGSYVITHKLSDSSLKGRLESLTNRKVKEVDTSEFEKSGGSVRCMTLDIHMK